MGGRRASSIVAAAAGLALCAWWLWPRGAPAPAPPSTAQEAPSRFRGVELTEVDADGTRWRLTAKEGAGWESKGTGGLRGVTAVFERRGRSVQVKSGRGDVKGGEVVTLSEGVTIQWDRYEARLDHATYERGKGMVRSADPLVLRGPGMDLTGKGLEIDVEGRRVHVASRVHATLRSEPAP